MAQNNNEGMAERLIQKICCHIGLQAHPSTISDVVHEHKNQ